MILNDGKIFCRLTESSSVLDCDVAMEIELPSGVVSTCEINNAKNIAETRWGMRNGFNKKGRDSHQTR